MSAREGRRFASRPGDAESWIRAAERQSNGKTADSGHTARLTIDITPELRGRIKVAAFRRGVTVAVMLRDLLAREFPITDGDTR
ncbi:MAG: hypothetical protein ACI4XG_19470 [Bradyrhizobium sp.]